MKTNLFLFLATMASALSVKASVTDISGFENVLYVENAEVYSGKTVTLSLMMNNNVEAVGFQCDFFAPAQTSVVPTADGSYEISLSEARTTSNKTNFFDCAMQSDGSIRILASSTRNQAFSGNSGEVATIKLSVDNDLTAGTYPLILRNITIADAMGNPYRIPEVETELVVKNYTLGDANNDSSVDISDYTMIANNILGKEQSNFVKIAADINEDNIIDVADLSGLVKMILGNHTSFAPALKATDVTEIENTIYGVDVEVGEDGLAVMSVCMKNSIEVPGFQFDVVIPEGFNIPVDEDGYYLIELSTERTSSKRTNTFDYTQQPDGSIRVLAASTRNLPFSGNDGEVCTITFQVGEEVPVGDYQVSFKGIVLSDLDGNAYRPEPTTATLTVKLPTGAELIGADALEGAVIFGADGVRRAGLQPGVNIVHYRNGVTKKVMVK